MAMARYLRDPQGVPPPEGVEPRRLKIYQDLIYKNIESFISSGFPVLRSLYEDGDWHGLVRSFIDGHRCTSPYFLEISQEFLQFLLQEHQVRDCDPPFMAELAHYEWVELALDVSEERLPPDTASSELLETNFSLSPLAWVLAYRFPVHRIGPAHRPEEPGEPTYLAVYRDRADKVQFMELNAASARLLELCRDEAPVSGRNLLSRLATELSLDETAVVGFGSEQLGQFLDLAVLRVAIDS
jgi:hypothetical protein